MYRSLSLAVTEECLRFFSAAARTFSTLFFWQRWKTRARVFRKEKRKTYFLILVSPFPSFLLLAPMCPRPDQVRHATPRDCAAGIGCAIRPPLSFFLQVRMIFFSDLSFRLFFLLKIFFFPFFTPSFFS